MLELALKHEGPCAIRYPKASAETVAGKRAPAGVRQERNRFHGRRWHDRLLAAPSCPYCIAAAKLLSTEGLEIGRDQCPLRQTARCRNDSPRHSRDAPFVVTVEEAALMAASARPCSKLLPMQVSTPGHVRRLGIPDQYIEHGRARRAIGRSRPRHRRHCRLVPRARQATQLAPLVNRWRPNEPPRAIILADGLASHRARHTRSAAAQDRAASEGGCGFRPTSTAGLAIATPTWPSCSAATARSCGPHGKMGYCQRPVLGVNLGQAGLPRRAATRRSRRRPAGDRRRPPTASSNI